jgi:hypothetical protein
VIDHFGPHRDHPLIDEIEFSDSRVGDYFEWRTASLAYRFEGRRIVSGPQREGLPYAATTDASGWFHDQVRLLEDFAEETGFREFYAEHGPFYEEQGASYKAKVPVERMWEWLETQFPARYDAYSVVFSPLINASHNTIRFEHNGFRECIMVVGGPDLLAGRTNDARVEEAALSRHVFTEIDHNYVNPVSARYAGRINDALADLDAWNEQDGYASAVATFNEYVTWAIFIIYAADYYQDEVLAPVRDHEIRSMEEGRGFPRFGAFVTWLEERWDSAGRGTTLAELYPEMIEWFAAN